MTKIQELQNRLNARLSELMKENASISDRYNRRLLSEYAYNDMIKENGIRQDELRKTLVLLVVVKHP